MTISLTVYSRPDCHLCEVMLNDIKQCMAGVDYDLEIINIDEDASLQTRFGGRIPVLMYDDKIVSEYFLDSEMLKQVILSPD